jgi:mono/diheme cytochrome c family protein
MLSQLKNYWVILIRYLRNLKQISLIIFLTTLILSCGPVNNEAYQKLSTADKAKFRKYVLLGKEIYDNKCASCHQTNGQGLRGVIPPLAQADYLEENQMALPCLLKYATEDTIMVNGRTYPPEMPAHDLTNLELAEVITYINNSWENELGFMSVKRVDSLLQHCN